MPGGQAGNVLYHQRHPLDSFFAPRNVAMIGATDTASSIGRTVLWNLISSPFGGTVFPVNLKHHSVLGIKAYHKVKDIPEKLDLAIIATPAPGVPELVRECVEVGIKNAIIISSGFKDRGEEGVRLEKQILEEARRGKMRLVGPNSLGVMCPPSGLNASCARHTAQPGNVAFISQSAAVTSTVLDWSLSENVGFSAVVAVGSMLDVGWGELISYFGSDQQTKSIVVYMETLNDVRSFLSAAREVSLNKPLIVLKAGTQNGSHSALSHTGTLTGRDDVFEAAFRRCGVLRVNRISELFDLAEVLAKQPRPRGRRLTIITNTGAAGILATDALTALKGELAPLPESILQQLNESLPVHWSKANPIDIMGDASPQLYAKALEIALKNPESDGAMVILAAHPESAPTETAEALKEVVKNIRVPVLASWMGRSDAVEGTASLTRFGIPTFPYPDTAARMFCHMWRYNENLHNLYETPVAIPDTIKDEVAGRAEVEAIITAARKENRTTLSEIESKHILEAYHIPTIPAQLAVTLEEALQCADGISYPVSIMAHIRGNIRSAEYCGEKNNLLDERALRAAYLEIAESISNQIGKGNFLGVTVQPSTFWEGIELIIGSSVDPQFGPILMFGSGGKLVESYNDRSITLPPLNTTLARRMVERTRIFGALANNKICGGVDLEELERLLVRFSRLVVEQRWIKEIDINPVLASPEGLVALHARMVLHDPSVAEENLPQLAIRPYPTHYLGQWFAKDETSVIIRPIRPEDEPLVVKYHETLSERSVYFRYLHMLSLNQRIEHDRLTKICFIDYDREIALVIDYEDPETKEHQILGIGRLSKVYGTNEAEFAILISDNQQGRGYGKELLLRLIQIGRDEKLEKIVGYIHPENMDMQRVCERVGFKRRYSMEEGLIEVWIVL
jgi:acetyltransferase